MDSGFGAATLPTGISSRCVAQADPAQLTVEEATQWEVEARLSALRLQKPSLFASIVLKATRLARCSRRFATL